MQIQHRLSKLNEQDQSEDTPTPRNTECRKRIFDAFGHRQPSRCPTFTWIDDEALEPLAADLGVGSWHELEDRLNIDRWRLADLQVAWPENHMELLWKFIPEEFHDRDDVVMSEDEGRILKMQTPEDALGEIILWHPLQAVTSLEEFAEYPFPDLYGLEIPDDFAATVEAHKDGDKIVWGTVDQPFKYASHLRGVGNLLSDFVIRPETVEFLYDRIYRFMLLKAEALAEAGVDVIEIDGDIAMQDRLLMSPAIWRSFERPRLAEVISEVRSIKPDICIGIHSDGRLTEIVPDLVEIGIDFLNPVQPECMDPFELKQSWGHRLLIYGGVSHQMLTTADPDTIREYVRKLVRECGRDGGLVVGPANAILPGIPTENIVALYDAVD